MRSICIIILTSLTLAVFTRAEGASLRVMQIHLKDGSIEIVPFTTEHHTAAAELVARRYHDETECNPLLAGHFRTGKNILPILWNNQEKCTGVAAIHAEHDA